MYITATTILLFFILMAILDGNKKNGEQSFFEELGLAVWMIGAIILIIGAIILILGVPIIIIYLLLFPPETIHNPIDWIFSLHPFYLLCIFIVLIIIASYGENTETIEKEIKKEKPLWSKKESDNMMKFAVSGFIIVLTFLLLLFLLIK